MSALLLGGGKGEEKRSQHRSGKTFFGIVRELTSPEIELEVDEKTRLQRPRRGVVLQNSRLERRRISAHSSFKGR
jgi:hypothetical protein